MDKIKGKKYEFKYKWQTNVSDFNMPLEMNVGSKTIRLEGTNDLQLIEIVKKKKDKIKINQNQFYIKLKQF